MLFRSTADTLLITLAIYADMLRGISVNKANMRQAAMEGYATATDLADYLVKKGMAFRDAHEVVALAVKYGVSQQCDLADLPLDELQKFSALITQDVYSVLTLEGSIASRDHIGGTAPHQVKQAVTRARSNLMHL